jgi:hypothetical protein
LLENGFRTPLGKFCDNFTESILKPLIYIIWAYKNKIKSPPPLHTHTHCTFRYLWTYTYSITLYFRLVFSHKSYLVNFYILSQRPIKWLICWNHQCVCVCMSVSVLNQASEIHAWLIFGYFIKFFYEILIHVNIVSRPYH